MSTNPETPPTYDTVVFSRKKTFTDPNEGSSLASVIHQADKSGKQVGSSDVAKSGQIDTQPKGISKLFNNICNCLGLAEEKKFQQALTNKNANQPPPSPHVHTPTGKGHLGPVEFQDAGKKCLVLDLDETLVHSSFKPTKNPDFIIPVTIEGTVHNVYVAKRPGVDEFMRVMAEHYEIVIYTASLSKYAHPLLDQLDIHKTIRHRLFREHCARHEGNYVKDLSLLDRDLTQTIIIDNSAMSYIFHPENAIGCTSFIDDMTDAELPSIQNFLLDIVEENDVREHLYRWSPFGVGIRG